MMTIMLMMMELLSGMITIGIKNGKPKKQN